ncbi:hypothetical protein Trydic_g51 [Trypoxylus dichotomus]
MAGSVCLYRLRSIDGSDIDDGSWHCSYRFPGMIYDGAYSHLRAICHRYGIGRMAVVHMEAKIEVRLRVKTRGDASLLKDIINTNFPAYKQVHTIRRGSQTSGYYVDPFEVDERFSEKTTTNKRPLHCTSLSVSAISSYFLDSVDFLIS